MGPGQTDYDLLSAHTIILTWRHLFLIKKQAIKKSMLDISFDTYFLICRDQHTFKGERRTKFAHITAKHIRKLPVWPDSGLGEFYKNEPVGK